MLLWGGRARTIPLGGSPVVTGEERGRGGSGPPRLAGMEKKKIRMKSKVAAPNLLRALHSLYQFGHLCDVTVHTQHLGIQEEFLVHKAVLAASSNYFKGLFLHNEMLDTKNCTVTLQDIYTEEFTSFLEFIYTAEVEIEAEKLHRMKEIAERLECKDLLDICEEVKAEGRKGLDLSLHLKGQLCTESGGPQWPRIQLEESHKLSNASQVVAIPVQRKLWDRQKHKKLLAGYELLEGQPAGLEQGDMAFPDPKPRVAKLPRCNQAEPRRRLSMDVVSLQNKSSRSLLSQAESEEARVVTKSTLSEQWEEESSLISKFATKPGRRKPPRRMAKALLQMACEQCSESLCVTEQRQSHMDLKHNPNPAIKYSCSRCKQLFPTAQRLRQHHLTVHGREQGFSCVFCDKRFKRQKTTSDHMHRVPRQQQRAQACPCCDKIVSSKCALRVHMRTHTGEKPYKCEHCPTSFAHKSAYSAHVRKTHEAGQQRQLVPVYWMVVPPEHQPDPESCGRGPDRETWARTSEHECVRNEETTSCEEEPGGSSAAGADCSSEQEQKQKSEEGEARCEDVGEDEGEMSVKGEEVADDDVGDSEADDSRDNEDCTEEDEEEDEYPNEKDGEEHESDEEFKVKKVNKSRMQKKSAYVIRCEKCKEQFVSRKKYVDHCRDVHQCLPGKVYQCDICSKSFASYNSWKEHRACVHTEERQFACSLCNATFKRKRDVRTHSMRKHEGRVKRPLCSVCGKILSSRTALVFHMRTHTGEKPYECSICHSRFTQPSQLKIHTRSHTGEKPYICEDCGACFADKGKLTGHKRTHTGERLFKCDMCGKHFATNEYLKCHKRCHLGAKPYKCGVCGKTFGLRGSLAQHSNVHAETRPYFCEQCGKAFTQQGALRRHQRIHTGEKPYKCRACERTFTDMSTLRRHVSVHDRSAHWRSFVIDLTTKKDHNWSKIEPFSGASAGEACAPEVWSVDQGKVYKPESAALQKGDPVPPSVGDTEDTAPATSYL